MNAKAKELGMEDTNFVNCTGLDDEPSAAEHLTSAYDIALMSRELLLHHPDIKKIYHNLMDTVRNGSFGLANTNKLVRFYEGTTGLKTGYTSAAGHCLSASALRDGLELVAVVLHCPSSTDRFQSAKALLDYGFANYALVPVQEGETLSPVPVVLGQSETVQPVASGEEQLLIDKGLRQSVTRTVELLPSVQAPVSQGQRLGTLTIQADGQVLGEIPLVAEKRCPVSPGKTCFKIYSGGYAWRQMQRRNRESNSLRKNEVGAPKGAANLATSFLIRQAATRFARRRIVFYIPSAHSLPSGRARGTIRFQERLTASCSFPASSSLG